MNSQRKSLSSKLSTIALSLLLACGQLTSVVAQDTVTGAFAGTVKDRQTGTPITNATVRFTNQRTQVSTDKRVNGQGEFYLGLLKPETYVIQVSAEGYKTENLRQTLIATRQNTVQPLPITLEREVIAQAQPQAQTQTQAQTKDDPSGAKQPPAAGRPAGITASVEPIVDSVEITAELNATDGRRSGVFTEKDVSTLPLGSSTLTRSFDELALLLPGVALPPQTQGGVAGPGVGPGVGSAGQFSINGLRSRGNNFTVDGSDNNDEDIGVRRQGYFALVPQPIESIREYTVITALAPAQYGRNLSAQVNAISKSGGYQTHGELYGFLNTSALNARNYFDTRSNGMPFALQGRALNGDLRNVFISNEDGSNRQQVMVSNPAAGKDSLTFAQAGFAFGGPLLPRPANGSGKSAFYFLSFEGQLLNANKEESFAVPTVEQRGFGNTGASGFTQSGDPAYPTTLQGDSVYSLFPFPNNPTGVYGRNTFTQILPSGAQGNVASIKLDHSFRLAQREHSITGRYNRTSDWRNIPATGGALFATLRPVVETHNFSLFLNSELSGPQAVTPIFNQFRASYGRTRLLFEEERDREFQIPSSIFSNIPFLLNARYLTNYSLPNKDFVDYRLIPTRGAPNNTELGFDGDGDPNTGGLGPVGQVIIPGFSPIGVDVFSFPQRRVNNTYQLADAMTIRVRQHTVALGGDFRRTDLNSDLPRNSRPIITFGGAPVIDFDINPQTGDISNFRAPGTFFLPNSLAAASAASNFQQSLIAPGATSNINLRYYQFNVFAQDEWRVRPSFSLSYGLRYEYNTPPRERNDLIEASFKSAALNLDSVAGLKKFVDGRDRIFESDRNNFAPRVGFAYARNIFGLNSTVFRGGYGLYFDQPLGAVVSQSRNVFPSFITVNTGGGLGGIDGGPFDLFNPALSLHSRGGFANGICRQFLADGITCAPGKFFPYVVDGTLNRFNQSADLPLSTFAQIFNRDFAGGFGLTLPERNLRTPLAHHYAFTIEQQLGRNLVVSAGYVGTQGRDLLRPTTPNLGPNVILVNLFTDVIASQPQFIGFALPPGIKIGGGDITGGRPVDDAGAVFIYESSAASRYDSLQLQLRGNVRNALQYQFSYTLSKVIDDVSDVFDLAGAPALPQRSCPPNAPACNYDNERALANFDARQRLSYSFIYSLPRLSQRDRVTRFFFGGFGIASAGHFQTGQPFTVNSLFDVNLDGNLSDRLQTTNGLEFRDDRRQPIRLTGVAPNLRAQIGNDGSVGRNTFRASNYLLLNLAMFKTFVITERQALNFRIEAFNFLDRANFGVPIRFLEAPGFGQSTDTVSPGRRIQFGLKYSF